MQNKVVTLDNSDKNLDILIKVGRKAWTILTKGAENLDNFDSQQKVKWLQPIDIQLLIKNTAQSQLIEAQANRDSKVSLIVFHISIVENYISKNFENVGYISRVGFIAIINSQKGDHSNLVIAYICWHVILP